jgi:hypothetical protein
MSQLEAREDFDAARYRAFRRAIRGLLMRRRRELLSLEGVLRAVGREAQSSGGVQEIPLDRVVGSADAGRAKEFDSAFLPQSRRLRDRWSQVYAAVLDGVELDPIDVYKLGDNYYVSDGHHRVSVLRRLGRDRVKARVTNVGTRVPLPAGVDGAELLKAAEYAAFLDATSLDRVRPEARVEVSRLGRYDELLAHILGHRYFLGLEQGRDVSTPEAAASWYDNVYLPIAKAIRTHKVLERMPGSTEADLYLDITRRWLESSVQQGTADPHAAVHSLIQDDARRWWRQLRARLRRLGALSSTRPP